MRWILTVLLLAWSCASSVEAEDALTCGPIARGWVQTRADRSRPANSLSIDGSLDRPTWNGAPVTPGEVRQYLSVTARMSPRPVFLLIVGPHADCGEVAAYR